MDFSEWIELGIQKGWCGPPVCYGHEGLPASKEEERVMFEYDDDSCLYIVRLYDSPELKADVERNHLPSTKDEIVFKPAF